MYWESLRRGTTIVVVEREHSHDKLFAENMRFRVDDDARMLDVSVDLNKSLRTRSRGVSTYIDAKALAESLPGEFKSLTIDDHGVIDHVRHVLEHLEFKAPDVWRLHVALKGDYWFRASPEYKRIHAYERLTFNVQSVLHDPPLL
jgi:hypothetical protein